MENQEVIIRQALIRKGVSLTKMCEEIGYSDVSLYRYFKNGVIRQRNKKTIMDYLGLKDGELEGNVINDTKFEQTSYTPDFIDRLLGRIENQAVEIFSLKKELGKFESPFLALSM